MTCEQSVQDDFFFHPQIRDRQLVSTYEGSASRELGNDKRKKKTPPSDLGC